MSKPAQQRAPGAATTSRTTRAAISAVSALLLIAPVAAMAEVDLIGSWFVLIHYRDTATANPTSDRWEDKVWKFQKKGSRLVWTEYPIVVFNDKQGRFGQVGRNPRARLLHAWEPNEGQQMEIDTGLQVNSRGSKTKALRGSPKRGYASTSRSRATSAFTVGYQENWSIDKPRTMPVFTRDDTLGSDAELAAGEGGASGRTLYKSLEVRNEGNVLVGTYMRDENKKGTFRLIRSGAARGLETDGRTPNEKMQDRQREQFQAAARNDGYKRFMSTLGDDNLRALRAVIGEDGITAVWKKYEGRLIAGDQSAEVEIGDALRKAYAEGVERKIRESFAAGGPDALLNDKDVALDPASTAFLKNMRGTLGEEKLAELRDKYGEKIKAGDESAERELRAEIRGVYEAQMHDEFNERLRTGDPEAVRQMREAMRKERDRR